MVALALACLAPYFPARLFALQRIPLSMPSLPHLFPTQFPPSDGLENRWDGSSSPILNPGHARDCNIVKAMQDFANEPCKFFGNDDKKIGPIPLRGRSVRDWQWRLRFIKLFAKRRV